MTDRHTQDQSKNMPRPIIQRLLTPLYKDNDGRPLILDTAETEQLLCEAAATIRGLRIALTPSDDAPMTDMIERVAREILEAHKDWLFGKDAEEDLFRTMARAAIVAMREPTEVMLDAAMQFASCDLKSEWQAMVDAALGGKQ